MTPARRTTTGARPRHAVSGHDPFGTAAVRERVLAAWAASPARFREDANAEEDFSLGGYRDRVIVELAQNAADAAARPVGRSAASLSTRTTEPSCAAANTGTRWTRPASRRWRPCGLRPSGAAAVGRFGVGFAAVLSVTDEPAVRSTSGGVRFSAVETRAAVAGVPALAAELDRRGGQVPVLRLPWPADPLPAGEWDTEVLLPLRPDAVDAVGAALAGLDPVLLLALPALRSIDAGGRVLSRLDEPVAAALPDGGGAAAGGAWTVLRDGERETRWIVRSATGVLPADLLATRPAEERDRPEWTVSWAVPVDAAGRPVPPSARPVVHAPTPTDEPLSLPAVLLGAFPLASDRRHVTPGPVTDLLVAAAARAYADLVAALPPDPTVLTLVPRPSLAAAELDAAATTAVLAALRDTRFLPQGDGDPVAAADAVVVDAASEQLVAALADLVPGLLPASWSGRAHAPALDPLPHVLKSN